MRRARGAAIRGMRIAYTPDYGVFPVEPRGRATVVREAVRAFEEAGARVEEVRLGIPRDQRELSDLWCRLIIPLTSRRFERSKRRGHRRARRAPRRLPPEYLRWLDEGERA